MPKFGAYMRGEGTKGEQGDAAGFNIISATTHAVEGEIPIVSVTTSGDNTALNIDFDFGLVRGEAAGFSTNQNATIHLVSVTSNPSISITTENNSPNNSKVFNFDFGIPQPNDIIKIEQTITSTTDEGNNEITVFYRNGQQESFLVKNGSKGTPAIIEGAVSTTNELPSTDLYNGTAYIVGTSSKRLYVWLNNEWTDQGPITAAGFGVPTASIEMISVSSNPLVSVTTDPNSPESAKIFNFNFKIPEVPGPQGEKGDTPIITLSTSVTTLSAHDNPTVFVSTLDENSFKFDFGIPESPVPMMTATVSTSTLNPLDPAAVGITVNENIFHFDFGIPKGTIGVDGVGFSTLEYKGQSLTTNSNIYEIIKTDGTTTSFEAPAGPEGIGFYQELIFTSTNGNNYSWISEDESTSTLIIDRTSNKIIPVSIYNSNKNNIAATFTVTESKENYPNGTVEYNTKEKFDGILYFIGKSPTPQLAIGSVTTVEGAIASVSTEKQGNNYILNFTFPTKGDPGNGIESIEKVSVEGLTTNYRINYTQNDTPFEFSIQNGAQGPQGISVQSITKDKTEGLVDTYNINYSNGTTTSFEIVNGEDGTDGVDGISIQSVTKENTSGLVDTYYINYSNGTTTSFEITNGQDGIDHRFDSLSTNIYGSITTVNPVYNTISLGNENLSIGSTKWSADGLTTGDTCYEPFIYFHDADGQKIGEFSTFHREGNVAIQVQASQTVYSAKEQKTKQCRNAFRIGVRGNTGDENSGAPYFEIDNPIAFLNALGVTYTSTDIGTGTSLSTGNIVLVYED